jgi:prepilin-type processing-associated H-X9-DG protein
VVIAIIAILAAILFPVFARARAKAQQNSCLSNVKQLDLGYLMYCNDWDGVLPNFYVGNQPSGNCWFDQISPYVKNTQIYLCPSDAPSENGMGANELTTWGYMANWDAIYFSTASPAYKLDIIQYPAEMWFIADGLSGGKAGNSGQFDQTHRCDSFGSDPVNANGCVPFRHNSGANLGFGDGHAKWLSGGALVLLVRGSPIGSAGSIMWTGR